jgi:hypothetical protein
LDEVCHRLVGEMAFERIPAFDLSAPALEFQLDESPQGTEEMVADGGLPAHEKPFRVADLFDRSMIALNAPMLPVKAFEVALSGFHALFFRGSYAA